MQFCKFSIGDLWEAWAHEMLPNCMPDGWEYMDLHDMKVQTHGGVVGHLDGLLTNHNTGEIIISDCKLSAPTRHKEWDDGMPDRDWGQLHQAANYIEGFGPTATIGFIWPTVVPAYMGPWKTDVGYATAAELKPYHKETAKFFAGAKEETPPVGINNGKCNYCEFRSECKK